MGDVIKAKRWLNRAWRVNRELEMLARTKISLFERMTNATAGLSGLPDAASPDPHKLDEYAAYCEQVNARARELALVSAEVMGVIACVEDGRLRQLLILRYVEFLTWEQIAVRMNYSWRWTMQLHAEALQVVERLLDERQHSSSYPSCGTL